MLKTSVVFFAGNMLTAFGGLILTIVVARLMGTVEYGIFGTLMGLMYFMIIPVGALDLLITKTVSSFNDDQIYARTKLFLIYLFQKTLPIFVLFLIILSVVTIPLKNYLHLDNASGLLLLWLIVYLSIASTILSSTLKGLMRFIPITTNLVVSMLVRILISITIVYAILPSHLGGMIGIAVAAIIAVILYTYQLREIWELPTVNLSNKSLGLKKMGLFALLISGAFTAMYSLDMIFVRHYLDGYQSGIYASLATAGKMIFFAISPVASLVLPLVSKKSGNPNFARADLIRLTLIVLGIGISGSIAFFIFPKLIVNTIFSSKFGDAAVYLPVFGLVMLAYSLSNVFGNFLIGLNKFKSIWIVLLTLISQIALINIFHANIFQIIVSMGLVFFVQCVLLFAYCWYATKKTN
jgi:O-antigen/teichoic acid export membrane protein